MNYNTLGGVEFNLIRVELGRHLKIMPTKDNPFDVGLYYTA